MINSMTPIDHLKTEPVEPIGVQNLARTLYREAMDLMDEHDRLKRADKNAEARRVALNALQLEKQALTQPLNEPFRSFVYRSAASIALDAGQINDALALLDEAFSRDDVPKAIFVQLQEIARIARERAAERNA